MTEETVDVQQEQEDKPVVKAKEKKPAKTSIVTFGDNIEIYTDSPLPEYDSEDVKAYRAVSKEKGGPNYFALICERHIVPRIKAASVYSSIINPSLVPLVAAGVVHWTPTKQQRCVFVYKDVLGKRLLKADEQALGWRQDDVMASVVKPMIGVLQDFRNKDFVHGAIRPSNMFFEGTTSNPERKIILGDCLSTPASYGQSVLYETIERSMADPIARGEGTHRDDIYAFGVALAVCMRANDPLKDMTDEEIIEAKIEFGSYAAVTGKERFKGSILELLRGVLHDDPTQRWTIDEVMTWMDGRRLSPKQSIKEKKAPRPILFHGKKYFLSSFLAMAMHDYPQESLQLVDSGELEQWLTRSLEDDQTAERVDQAIKSAREKGTGQGYDLRLAANLSIALDPKAPIRYHGYQFMGDGVGKALVQATVLKKEIQPYVELFAQNIAMNWVTAQKSSDVDVGSLISRFDSCRSFIRQGKIGYGIERCVYVLCPESHCLSERLNDYMVSTPEDLLIAFEDLCNKGRGIPMFIDRHMAAFLSAKDSKVIDSYLFDLGAPEEYKKILGNLKCFAAIQARSSMPKLPGVAQVYMDALPVICERYHDREIRHKLEKSISKFAAEGDLARMASVLSNIELLSKDFEGFKRAMREYIDLSTEYTTLDKRLADKATFGKSTGREIAAVVSSVIAGLIILYVSFMFFTHQKFF